MMVFLRDMTRHRFTSIIVGLLALQLSLVGDSSPCRSSLSGITHGGGNGSDAMAMAPADGDQGADAAPGNGSCDMPGVPTCHLATPCAVSFVAEIAVNGVATLAPVATVSPGVAVAPASIVSPPDLPPPRA